MQILEDLLALFSCLDEAYMGFNPNGQCSLLTGSVTSWPVGLCFSQWDLLTTGKRQIQTCTFKSIDWLEPLGWRELTTLVEQTHQMSQTRSPSRGSEGSGHMDPREHNNKSPPAYSGLLRCKGCSVLSRFLQMEAETQAEMWKNKYIKPGRGKKPENEPCLESVTHGDRLGPTCAHCAAYKMS